MRRHLTYANVVASLALFVALGGSSYAALKISGKQIKNRTISGKKLKRNTLGGTQIKESQLKSVPQAKLADKAASADSAGTAGNAGTLDGEDSSAFKVRCPSGTAPTAGVCVETTSRPEVTWEAAYSVCANANRGLPTLSQLLAHARSASFPATNDEHWSSESGGEYRGYSVTKADDFVSVSLGLDTSTGFVRCAVNPAN
jgi:hypothetical protein